MINPSIFPDTFLNVTVFVYHFTYPVWYLLFLLSKIMLFFIIISIQLTVELNTTNVLVSLILRGIRYFKILRKRYLCFNDILAAGIYIKSVPQVVLKFYLILLNDQIIKILCLFSGKVFPEIVNFLKIRFIIRHRVILLVCHYYRYNIPIKPSIYNLKLTNLFCVQKANDAN